MSGRKKQSSLVSLIFVLLAVLGGFWFAQSDFLPASGVMPENTELTVHYIDVGQGDATLVELPGGKTLLIDAGDNGKEQQLLSYLDSAGVERIDYLVGTHPHADHIGGMLEVVKTYPIGEIFMPKVSHTANTYIDLLSAIQEKGLGITTARQGKVLFSENGAKAEFLAPCSDSYSDLNNYSAVLRLTYKDTAFLFTGDAEVLSEKEILQSGKDVSADVLKVGHHGSSGSNSSAFLDAVSPSFAIISCGAGNSYGHPHTETLEKLENANVQVFRTDEMGTILVETDGRDIGVHGKQE